MYFKLNQGIRIYTLFETAVSNSFYIMWLLIEVQEYIKYFVTFNINIVSKNLLV